MIALAAGLALLIGWYRGFTLRAIELTAAAFAVVLAIQTVGMVVTSREAGPSYWVTVVLIGLGWVACVWIGAFARRFLRR